MDPTHNTSNSDPALVLILGEIKGQLGTYMKFMETLQGKHDNLETRTRALENAKFWLMGAAAALGGLAGVQRGGHQSIAPAPRRASCATVSAVRIPMRRPSTICANGMPCPACSGSGGTWMKPPRVRAKPRVLARWCISP